MLLDVISSVVGLVFPPAFDFIKKKFLPPKSDTPQATLASLAVSKPDIMPAYIEAQAKLIDAEIRLYNRDVVQQLSAWVADLRASIRPIFTIISLALMFCSAAYHWQIDPSIKSLMEITISSWFGSRLISN